MKKILLLIMLLSVCGCAALDVIDAVITPIAETKPQPQPICDADMIGVPWENQRCLKFDDGTYQWVKVD